MRKFDLNMCPEWENQIFVYSPDYCFKKILFIIPILQIRKLSFREEMKMLNDSLEFGPLVSRFEIP